MTVNQQEDLITIWKDEKLAFDVYTALNGAYTLPIFATIASSEEQHLIAVERLLERNGVNVPVAEDPTALVTQGSSSLVAAMEAGIYIERKDIDDLTAALKEVSGRKDLLRVYTNLLSGSEDHLEAFESHLALLATNQ